MKRLTLLLFMTVCASFSAMYAQTKVYLDVSRILSNGNRWDYTPNDNPTSFQVYSWIGTGDNITWSAGFTKIAGEEYIYETTIPDENPNFIVVRREGQSPATGWTGVNNQTRDLILSEGNYVMITDWGSAEQATYSPITIKVNTSAPNWGNTISIYYWFGNADGAIKPSPLTSLGDGWYGCTLYGSPVNLIFINGTNWGNNPNQTTDIKNNDGTDFGSGVNVSSCFIVQSNSDGKHIVSTGCPEATVELSGVSDGDTYYVGDEIELSATSTKVLNPVYTYWYSVDNGSSWEKINEAPTPETTISYAPAAGTYCFKVDVAESTDPGNVLKSSEETPICNVEVVQAIVELKSLPKTITAGAAGTVIISSQGDLEDALGEIETNVEDPAYTFWIKVAGESDDAYEMITYPLTLTEDITYTIKVCVAESGAITPPYLACDEDDLEIGRYTGLAKTTISGYTVTSGSTIIQAQFEGAAAVELYTISGVLLKKTVAVGSFEQTGLAPGLYIVKINGEASKVAVK